MKLLKKPKKILNSFFLLLIFVFPFLFGCQQEIDFLVEDSILVSVNQKTKNSQNLIIPEGVTSIDLSLSTFPNLKTIELPSTFIDLSPLLFTNCSSLIDIHISLQNKYFWSSDGIVYSKSKNILIYYPEGKTSTSFTINVPAVGKKAFFNNRNLQKVIMTEKVININTSAFENCQLLEEVILSPQLLEIPKWAFKNCENLHTILITENIKKIGEQAFANNYSLTTLTIPQNVLYIEKEAFYQFSSQQTITINQPKPFVLWDQDWNQNSTAQFLFVGQKTNSSFYLALGDSVAAGHMSDNSMGKGYADYLGEKLTIAEMITNFHNDFAKSGMTSNGLLYRLKHPDYYVANNQTIIEAIALANIITISIGANDILGKLNISWSPFGLSYDITEMNAAFLQLESNYIEIINIIRSLNPQVSIYLIGYYMPLPYFTGQFTEQDYALFSMLDETINHVAQITNNHFVDISKISSKQNIPNPFNIHPGKLGYQMISEIIFQKIRENK